MTQALIAAKVRWRLALPCIFFMLMSSLDRANISFAAASMNAELGFTPSQYGFGAGVLFVGFLAGQYPSLYLLQRIGMRGWIATCALLWGVCAGTMGFITDHTGFYVLRVLIGLAEGGLAPGIVFYLSQFATERERATTFTLPMLAIPTSVIIGAPLSGWLLGLTHDLPLSSWRFMFVAEAIPTLLLGFAALFYFPNTPAEARWLTADERQWLASNAARRASSPRQNDWSVLRQPLIALSGLLWFCLLSGSYGVIFWLPQVIQSLTGLEPFAVGIIGALPWVGVAIGMYFNASHSDRTGERFWHVALPAMVAAAALLLAWQCRPRCARDGGAVRRRPRSRQRARRVLGSAHAVPEPHGTRRRRGRDQHCGFGRRPRDAASDGHRARTQRRVCGPDAARGRRARDCSRPRRGDPLPVSPRSGRHCQGGSR